jgi:hypothetical protein
MTLAQTGLDSAVDEPSRCMPFAVLSKAHRRKVSIIFLLARCVPFVMRVILLAVFANG